MESDLSASNLAPSTEELSTLVSAPRDGAPGQTASRKIGEIAASAPGDLAKAVHEGGATAAESIQGHLAYAVQRDPGAQQAMREGLESVSNDPTADEGARDAAKALAASPALSGPVLSPDPCSAYEPSPVPDVFESLVDRYTTVPGGQGPNYWIVAVLASDGTGTARIFLTEGIRHIPNGAPDSQESVVVATETALSVGFPICNCVPDPLADPDIVGAGGPFPPTKWPRPWKVTAFCDADEKHPISEYGPHYVRFDGTCADRGTWLHDGGPGWCQGTQGCIRSDQQPIVYIGMLEKLNPGTGRLIVVQNDRTKHQMFPAH